MKKKYSIEDFREYLENTDSLGDALYFLDKIDEKLEDIRETKKFLEEGIEPEQGDYQ